MKAVFDPDTSCSGKIPYTSKQDAVRAMVNVKRRKGDLGKSEAYFCPLCSTYHWGRRRGNYKSKQNWR